MDNDKKILIISPSDLKNDPRVYRQIEFFGNKYSVTALGFENPDIDSVKYIGLSYNKSIFVKISILFFRIFRMWALLEKFQLKYKIKIDNSPEKNIEYDLIIANDIDSFPPAFNMYNANKYLLDLHEYAPLEFEDKLSWRILRKGYAVNQCKKYLIKADKVITVCQSISDEYFKNYTIRAEVITNAAKYYSLKPTKVKENKIRIIHHGAAIPSRKIELMIKMMDLVNERFELDLMLVPAQKNYYEYLKTLAKVRKNINIVPPVSMNKIVESINTYDIGLFLLPPTNFNYRNALPNKFFEFIQARLMLAVGPSPEMSRLIKENDLGIVSRDFSPEEMAKELNSLNSERIEYYKNNSDKIAYDFSLEKNYIKLNDIVSNLLNKN